MRYGIRRFVVMLHSPAAVSPQTKQAPNVLACKSMQYAWFVAITKKHRLMKPVIRIVVKLII